eukprot:1940465-Alexandrium_andersonii.AAC.1
MKDPLRRVAVERSAAQVLVSPKVPQESEAFELRRCQHTIVGHCLTASAHSAISAYFFEQQWMWTPGCGVSWVELLADFVEQGGDVRLFLHEEGPKALATCSWSEAIAAFRRLVQRFADAHLHADCRIAFGVSRCTRLRCL